MADGWLSSWFGGDDESGAGPDDKAAQAAQSESDTSDDGVGWGEIVRQVGAAGTRLAGAYTNYAGADIALQTAGLQSRTNAILSAIDQTLMARRNLAYMTGVESSLRQIEQAYGDRPEAARAIGALRATLGQAAAATAASEALARQGGGATVARQIGSMRGMADGSTADEEELRRKMDVEADRAAAITARERGEDAMGQTLEAQKAARIRGVRGMEPDTAGALMPYQQALREVGVAGAARTERYMSLQPLLRALSGAIAEGTAYGTGVQRDYQGARSAEQEQRQYQGRYFSYQPPVAAVDDEPEVGGTDDADEASPYSLYNFLDAVGL